MTETRTFPLIVSCHKDTVAIPYIKNGRMRCVDLIGKGATRYMAEMDGSRVIAISTISAHGQVIDRKVVK